MTLVAFARLLDSMNNTQAEIITVCDKIRDLLLSKNAKYGDSALDPVRVFSSASTVEQILVRIDDKLSRVRRGAGLLANDEDVINDLIGYLVLLKIALNREVNTTQEYNPVAIINTESTESGYLTSDPWDGTDLDNPRDFLGGSSFTFNVS